MSVVWIVLYTPNLTQKRKKWFDGKLKLDLNRSKIRLIDEEGRPIAEKPWAEGVPSVGETVHFPRFIVEIDAIESLEEPKPFVEHKPPVRPSVRQKRPMGLPLDVLLKDPKLRIQPFGAKPVRLAKAEQVEEQEKEETGKEQHKISVPNEPNCSDLFLPDEWSDGPLDDHPSTPPDAHADASLTESFEESIVPPEYYDLTSDLESDIELVEVADRPRRSLFENMPPDLSTTGPWTKEAYLLFSWHPPVVKEEPV